MLRSPWLGPLAFAVAGVIGYALSEGPSARTVDAVTVTIRPTRENGAGWDFGGGLPDPKITVGQGDHVLATCEAKDQLKVTCAVRAPLDRTRGALKITVVDVDSSDDDLVGELVADPDAPVTTGTGAVQAIELRTRGGDDPWRRFRPLWIALAIGLALAAALARYRQRHA